VVNHTTITKYTFKKKKFFLELIATGIIKLNNPIFILVNKIYTLISYQLAF